MKKLVKIWTICLFVVLSVGQLQAENKAVYDEANLLSENDKIALADKLHQLEETYDIDIVLLTTNQAEGKSATAYADDFYDDNGFSEDGILMLIDMDNREIVISTSGKMIQYFTDERIESTIDTVYDDLVNANYNGSFSEFLNEVEYYMEQGIPDNQYTYHNMNAEERVMWVVGRIPGVLIGSLLIGFIITAIYTKRGRKFKFNKKAKYVALGNVVLNESDDILIDSKTTRVYVQPRSTSSGTSRSGGGSRSSGRSTTHTSSSGRSHGGGSRKF